SLAVIGAILIVCIISYAAVLHIRRYGKNGRTRTDRCRDVLGQWAQSRGIAFDEELMRIHGAVAGIDVLVSATYDQIEWSLPPALMMSSIASLPQPVVVQVGESWFALEEKIARYKVELDDARFNSAFKTWSDPADGAQKLLTSEIRNHLIELKPDELLYDRGVIEIRWEDDFANSVEHSYRRLDCAFTVVSTLCQGAVLDAA
ncbi:MAG: hypothetical protein H7X80_02080, partial [bacterium]|nr:hypothetical protein [Candidatus Kapabacteria bacterium]